MKAKLFTVAFFCVAMAGASRGQTHDFTYQGRLIDGTFAASGNYDFIFRMYAELDNPSAPQIGTEQVRNDIAIANGIFTVLLTFGPTAFDGGGERYLEIHVRPGASTGAYAVLTPRQRVTSAPLSIRSAKSGSADSLSSSCVMCISDAQLFSIDGAKVIGPVTSALTANNVAGIVGIANGGTGSSTKNFVDLTTDQTIAGNKSFTSLSGNGAGLVNVPGTLKWQSVAGPAQQAQPNNGYLVNDNSQVTITLPASPNVGDTVRVSGVGSGGWKIAQNPGQSVIGTNIGLIGANWTLRQLSASRIWVSVASSADGNKLVAVSPGGQIYISTDAGVSWTLRETSRNWQAAASSADGTKLVAVVFGGQIYTSTNSGVDWVPRENSRDWTSVASSADGNSLAAVVYGGQIYTSTNSGESWTPQENNRNWVAVAASADGSRVIAAVDGGQIYLGTYIPGSGWTARESNRSWASVATSADGSKLVAVASGGQIYTSSALEFNWTPRESNRNWRSVASSADGRKLVAAASNGQIYVSDDSGLSWIPRENIRSWISVASSADGSRLVATAQIGPAGGSIYTSGPATTIGTAGFLSGQQYSAIELQYIGDGKFLPLSYAGTITGN